jgi:hypothetical protein
MLRRTTRRRIEHDGRCDEETRNLRNGHTRCPLTGGEPSRLKITQRHSSRGWTAFPHPHVPPGEQSLPSDGRRTRPDHLAWLTGAALWLCFCLVHLFYKKDIPRPVRKDKPGVSLQMDFAAGNGRKEVFRYRSTTGNFPALERFEGDFHAMR